MPGLPIFSLLPLTKMLRFTRLPKVRGTFLSTANGSLLLFRSVKVVTLGSLYSGKTSWIRRLHENTFEERFARAYGGDYVILFNVVFLPNLTEVAFCATHLESYISHK